MRPRIAIVAAAATLSSKFCVLRSAAEGATTAPCRSYPSSDSKRGLRAEQPSTQSGLRKKEAATSFVFSTKWIQLATTYTLCVIFTILVSLTQDNALFASKAKINVS